MVEFTDKASVEAWCRTRSVKEIAVFGGLAAARAYPRIILENGWDRKVADLSTGRALLTLFVGGVFAEKAIRHATKSVWLVPVSAFVAATTDAVAAATAPTVAIAAYASATAVVTTGSAALATNSSAAVAANISALASAENLEENGVLGVMSTPLWRDGMPPKWAELWDEMKKARSKEPQVWGFWIDWYEGLLEGRAPDWELWRGVALIDDAIWQAGPEAVAAAIEGVKAELVRARLPLAEDLVADPETGLFSVVPRVVANLPLLAASLGQVRDAVEDVLAEASNGLREASSDIRVLRRAVERYANDPQRIEMDMSLVSASLVGQVAREDLPASSAVLALQAVVQQAAEGIRAAHPEIAANRALLREQARGALSDEAVAQIAEAGPVLEAISEGVLAEDMRDDVFALTEGMRVGAPLLGGVTRNGGDEIVRIGGRAAGMLLMLRKSQELVKRLAESTGVVGATIMLTLVEVVKLVLSLL